MSEFEALEKDQLGYIASLEAENKELKELLSKVVNRVLGPSGGHLSGMAWPAFMAWLEKEEQNCSICHKPVVPNIPRLGFAGGAVHADGSILCHVDESDGSGTGD